MLKTEQVRVGGDVRVRETVCDFDTVKLFSVADVDGVKGRDTLDVGVPVEARVVVPLLVPVTSLVSVALVVGVEVKAAVRLGSERDWL
jgi:hypothetical protein